jgi:cell filamentation protein, protein adenylyltransferase
VARDSRDASPLLRQLEPRQRRLLELYRDRAIVTTAEIAAHLGLSRRTVADLCRLWVTEGFLDLHDESRKGRSYRLGPAYERLLTL